MAIRSYTVQGEKLYEVYTNGFDPRGRRIQRRKRGIESIRKAQEVEFEFDREMARLREEGMPYTWKEWYEIVKSRMKLDLKASTLLNYDSYLGKWVRG